MKYIHLAKILTHLFFSDIAIDNSFLRCFIFNHALIFKSYRLTDFEQRENRRTVNLLCLKQIIFRKKDIYASRSELAAEGRALITCC